MDLDKCSIDEAIKTINKAQKKHNLNDALLVESSKGNYHAIFFDLKPFFDWFKINYPINPQHCGYSVFRGLFVLRISRKSEKELNFIKIVKSGNGKDNNLSLNHLNFFEKHFDINLKYLKKNALNNEKGEVLLEAYNARIKHL